MMPVVTSQNAPNYSDQGLQRLLSSLDQLHSKIDGCDLDLEFLKNLLHSNEFQSLMKVHEKVATPDTQEQKPLVEHSLLLACEVCEELCSQQLIQESQELVDILCQPHFRSLMSAHDRVAAQDFQPQLPDIPHEVDEDEESVKIVRLVKSSSEPLGATIRSDEKTGAIFIARVLHGGAADRSGLVNVTDEVLEVNGVSVQGKDPDDVVNILSSAVGTITLKLVPGGGEFDFYRESKMRVRAQFNYDPQTDKIIPCPEAGLSFTKGDILHIVSQDDPNWWQARHEGDHNMRAGLIPSRQLQERKEAIQGNIISTTTKETDKDGGTSKHCPKKSLCTATKCSPKLGKKSKKLKKIMYHTIQNQEYDAEEIVTYEEVETYYPKMGIYRPIVLIGPPGIGRNELKRRLIASNPNHFKATIPHTSRPKKDTEIDGEEYIFMCKPDMEKGIANKRFVEYGEYKGNLYGTSMEAIRSVVNHGYVCLLTPHPQALKMLRTAELKPYVIFVKPPSLERLKETRVYHNAKSACDEERSRPFTDEEFEEMISSATKIETVYNHYFDLVLVNEDLQCASTELSLAAQKIESEPQWVPASWVR